jgi:hypothetical protein
MRLQQSRSAAVMVAAGLAHAITGAAASSSARIETPILTESLTLLSLCLTVIRSNQPKESYELP